MTDAMTATTPASPVRRPFELRGVVVTWEDLLSADWLDRASRAGLNLVSVHTARPMSRFDEGRRVLDRAAGLGIAVEQEKHAMSELLPRDLFDRHPEYFRLNAAGERTPDFNCCPSSEEALALIAANAVDDALSQRSTTGRFYYWLDDGGERCECGACARFSASEQALLVENRIAAALRAVDPSFTLSHLAYQSTMPAPALVAPEPNVFLEFAPFFRSWDHPLANGEVFGPGWTRTIPDRDSSRAERRDARAVPHAETQEALAANLAVFGAATAQVLEYWLDVSLFSDWRLPAVELPWRPGVLDADLDYYAAAAITRVTSFAVYMDADYFAHHPETPVLEYGRALAGERIR